MTSALVSCLFTHALADHYVAQNGQTPAGTYTSWDTAASNIQDAVNVAYTNSTVWVGAGRYTLPTNAVVYNGTNVVYINRPLTLRSSNGVPSTVVIDGQGSNRGIVVYYAGTTTNLFVLDGLTVSNCAASVADADTRCYGAGIRFAPAAAATWTGIVQNCIISDNLLGQSSVYDDGAGIYGGYNSSGKYYFLVTNCVIRGNRNLKGRGGGLCAWSTYGSMAHSCLIESNSSVSGGGGAGVKTYVNCIFRGNMATGTAANAGGGCVKGGNISFTNCLAYNNTAAYGGGFAWSDREGSYSFFNCTIVSNRSLYGGAVRMDSASDLLLSYNSIVYSNSTIDFSRVAGCTNYITSSCYRTNGLSGLLIGADNKTNPPSFVNFARQDFHLSLNSSCLNIGTNMGWMLNATDLDGRQRILHGRVDMGAYEFIYDGTIYRTY